jgi:hypothetical protein
MTLIGIIVSCFFASTTILSTTLYLRKRPPKKEDSDIEQIMYDLKSKGLGLLRIDSRDILLRSPKR